MTQVIFDTQSIGYGAKPGDTRRVGARRLTPCNPLTALVQGVSSYTERRGTWTHAPYPK